MEARDCADGVKAKGSCGEHEVAGNMADELEEHDSSDPRLLGSGISGVAGSEGSA